MSTLRKEIIKGTYYSNWADNFGYPVAYFFVPLLAKIPFITPNVVTVFSFFLFTFGSVSLFLSYPYHLFIAAFCITVGYIGDDVDGQLARYIHMSSKIGDFLDKVLDVIKIFIITASLGYAVYLQTNQPLYLLVAFTAGYMFALRYYIKLETMFARISQDAAYLQQSAKKRKQLEDTLENTFRKLSQTVPGMIKKWIIQHRILLWVDEAEFAIFISIGALLNQLIYTLWLLAISQLIIAMYRFYERGYQLNKTPEELLKPLRK